VKRGPILLVALLVTLGVGFLVAVIANSGDDGGGGTHSVALPSVHGTTAPTDYRLVYTVTTPDGVVSEEHVVHRPFEAYVVNRDADGKVTAERWSGLGKLITRSQGAPAVEIDSAVAAAASDLRPDRFLDQLAEAKKVVIHDDESIDISGRTCHPFTEAGRIGAKGTGADPSQVSQVPVAISRCVDAQGLVLEERWTTQDGTLVLTKRARELDLGQDVPAIHPPRAQPLPDGQGNGAIHEVDRDQAPPFQQAFSLDAPKGFTFVGRYAVVPARVATDPSTTSAGTATDVAIYTDVWRHGPDLLMLDQGATKGEPPPFDSTTRIGTVDLGRLGTAELAVDLRGAEVRITLPAHGFLRLSGTLPLDQLTRLAGQIQPHPEAP
jgi:hypothetical protein